MNIDFYIFQKINGFTGIYGWLDFLGIFFAKYFEYALYICIAAFLIYNFKKNWPMFGRGLAAAVLARFGIVELIRRFWPIPRPFVEYPVNLLVKYTDKPAFPSGHAAFFFALSWVIYSYNKKTGILFFIASFLICLSRVFVGIHWPSDILAGAIVGIFSGWLIIRTFKTGP